MSMNDVIRQKRKELDLTQEQIASQLGVSIPAVSKWESGTTYPDVALIPALARILKTDVNTLLCFKQELSSLEIGTVMKKVSDTAMKEGFEAGYAIAAETIKEYPTDVCLIHSLAMTLQGLMLMTQLDEEKKEDYDQKIVLLYEKVGKSENSKYADRSNYMLASRAITEGEYEHAQELIDRLPEYNTLDKKLLQAKLWLEEDKVEDAAKIYEQRALSAVNGLLLPILQLIRISVQENDPDTTDQLVECGQKMTKAFHMWDYNSYVFQFEKAMAEKNVDEALNILAPMMEAMLVPWDAKKSPLFRHTESKPEEMNFGEKMLSNIISQFKKNKEYEFLRDNPKFQALITKYEEK